MRIPDFVPPFGCGQGLEDPEAVGEDYNVDEAEDGPRPFTALLDVGLKRTSTGSKVFAAMKVCAARRPRSFFANFLSSYSRSQFIYC